MAGLLSDIGNWFSETPKSGLLSQAGSAPQRPAGLNRLGQIAAFLGDANANLYGRGPGGELDAFNARNDAFTQQQQDYAFKQDVQASIGPDGAIDRNKLMAAFIKHNKDPMQVLGLQMQQENRKEDLSRQDAEIQRKMEHPATAQEKQQYGYQGDTPLTLNGYGNPTITRDPNAITPYQQEEINLSKSRLGEDRRHNQAQEAAARNPFGTSGSQATGDEFLKALPAGVASQVKAIANYRQAPPANRSSNAGMALMNAVNQYNPSYDASQYGAKVKARNDFTTGKSGTTVRSLNVAVQHLEQLAGLSDALGNGDIQAFNKIGQAVAQQIGRAAPTNFEATKQLVADEIVKAVVGTGGGVTDREEAAKTISRANSPAQLEGVIKQYQGLLGGQLKGLKRQYEKSTGLGDFEDYLDPLTRTKLENEGTTPPGKVIKYDAQGRRIQ